VDHTQYQPGVCNIGGAEVKRRRRFAQLGALSFILFAIYAVTKNLAPASAAISFFPAMIASVGYVQSRKKFCLAFGLTGTFNFAELGKISRVATREDIARDRAQALKIIFQSVVLAAFATAVLLALLSR